MKSKILVFLLGCLLSTQTMVSQSCSRYSDSLALVSLYNATNGPGWTNTWNLNMPMDSWYGVRLNVSGCVYSVLLPNNKLTGNLPNWNTGLEALRFLNLSNNKLTGDLPISIYSFALLEELELQKNQFTGSISIFIGDLFSLRKLDLSFNLFEGELPAELGNLANLIELKITDCPLIFGKIPDELSRCTLLEKLILANINLTDTIPASIGELQNLKYLHIYNTHVSGKIPISLGQCKQLVELFLNQNNLTGAIPDSLGNLELLLSLSLENNALTGRIPNAIGNCRSLVRLNASQNLLSGAIPGSLGLCTKLKFLYISFNQLTGAIPDSLFDARNLEVLNLRNNQLTGKLPEQIRQCTLLRELYLQNNQLTESLPATMSELTRLEVLELCPNFFTAPIPDLSANKKLDLRNVDFSCIKGKWISGHVVSGKQIQCNAITGIPVENVKMVLDNSYYTYTDSKGYYAFFVNEGSHSITTQNQNNLYTVACPIGFQYNVVVTANTSSIDSLNFGFNSLVDCSYLTTQSQLKRIRWCEENEVLVKVKNEGTDTAKSSFVILNIPIHILLISANYPWQNLNNGLYRIDFGNLAPGQEELIKIKIKIPCNPDILGKKLCIEVKAYPNHNCEPIVSKSLYDLDLFSTCLGDSILFRMINHSANSISSYYHLYRDFNLIDSVPFTIAALDTLEWKVVNSSQWTLIDVFDGNNDGTHSIWSGIEDCESFYYSIADFFSGSSEKRHSFACNTIRGSYDPNEKLVSPIGSGESQSILPNQKLFYTIYFENTGNDTAYRVKIVDIINEKVLDIESVQPSFSSHPFRLIQKGNQLEFILDPIKLVHKKQNDKQSQGYVSFYINQKANLPDFTMIENKASIFFDNNPAISTDPVRVRVASPKDLIISSVDKKENPEISIFPNPTSGRWFIRSSKEISKVELFTLDGKPMILNKGESNNEFLISEKGFYIVRLNGQFIYKLIVQ